MSEHPSTGLGIPFRIPRPRAVTMTQRLEQDLVWGVPGVTTESILRSRISELEAQVENLKAQLRK